MHYLDYDPSESFVNRQFHLELRYECDSIRTYGFLSLDDMQSYLDDLWPDAFISYDGDASPDFCDFWMYDDKDSLISSGRIWADDGLMVEYKKMSEVKK